ncbi:hypothetical protein BDR05DRAFT_947212 [Suillus weaverae]|nr:hypothetical protein BDR05DRAFT_947212 [Suillus weaverae]
MLLIDWGGFDVPSACVKVVAVKNAMDNMEKGWVGVSQNNIATRPAWMASKHNQGSQALVHKNSLNGEVEEQVGDVMVQQAEDIMVEQAEGAMEAEDIMEEQAGAEEQAGDLDCTETFEVTPSAIEIVQDNMEYPQTHPHTPRPAHLPVQMLCHDKCLLALMVEDRRKAVIQLWEELNEIEYLLDLEHIEGGRAGEREKEQKSYRYPLPTCLTIYALYDVLENYIVSECAGSAMATVVRALKLLLYPYKGKVGFL